MSDVVLTPAPNIQCNHISRIYAKFPTHRTIEIDGAVSKKQKMDQRFAFNRFRICIIQKVCTTLLNDIQHHSSCRSSSSLFPFTIPLPCQKLRVEIIKGRGNNACGRGNNAKYPKKKLGLIHIHENGDDGGAMRRADKKLSCSLSCLHFQRVAAPFLIDRFLFKTTCTA